MRAHLPQTHCPPPPGASLPHTTPAFLKAVPHCTTPVPPPYRTVDGVHGLGLVVAAREVEVGWVGALEGQQREDDLHAPAAAVHKVAVEEVGVGVGGQAVEVEDAQQVVEPARRGRRGRDGEAVERCGRRSRQSGECSGVKDVGVGGGRGGWGRRSKQGGATHWPCVSPHTVSSVPAATSMSTSEGSALRMAWA